MFFRNPRDIFYNMGEMSSVLFPYYQYIAELYISFLLYFLEISSESMETKEAREIKEEAVAPKAPIKEEDAELVTKGSMEAFPMEALRQTLYVGTDDPPEKLCMAIGRICPNLRRMYLDPVHVVIVYNKSHYRKPSKGRDH